MSELAMYLSGARAILGANTKSLARALQISDNIVTKLETESHRGDQKAEYLISYYTDLGLHFEEEKGGKKYPRIIGLVIKNVRKLTLSAAHQKNPDDLINRFLREMRYIGGILYNLKTIDRTKASRYDTIEIHFPISMRGVARQILRSWCETEERLNILYDGSLVEMDKEKIDDLLGVK